MKSPADTDPAHWHRFFAASANNGAWTLAELPAAELDARALLDAAHAAAWHWLQVGNALNQARARMLLALAHARAGLGTTALAYMDEVRGFFATRPDVADLETAFIHTIHAYAAFAAGDREKHASAYAEATRAHAAIANPDDRDVLQRVLVHVPAP
jgi:hypothetical protein